MTAFNTIVWATDGSESADHALEVAGALASQLGATLLAVHSVEFFSGGPRGGHLPANADEDERQLKIKRQVAELVERGVTARAELVDAGSTSPAHIVAEVAERAGADLIVCGTRGHTPVVGLLVGSVTQRLLHVAPCPVVVVPLHARDARSH